MLSAGRSRAAGDDGSLVVAVGVMMVLTFLSIAVLARSLASLSDVRRVQARDAALAAAESGLSDALFDVDQLDGALAAVTGSGDGFTWSATPDGDGYDVRVDATAQGASTAIAARVTRSTEGRWPFALFAQQDVVLDDGSGDRPPVVALNGVVGSNRSVGVRGASSAGGEAQWFYTPGGSCTGCTAGVQRSGPRVVPDPNEPAGAAACPVDGSGRLAAVLHGGTYACDDDVRFEGTVTVMATPDDPVVLWVGPGADVDLNDAVVNLGGDARELVVMKAGSGAVCAGAVTGGALGVCDHTHDTPALFTGVVYAPSADLKVAGQGAAVVGSVTVNAVAVSHLDDGDEPASLSVAYADELAGVPASDWSVCAWEQLPAGAPTPDLAC